MKVSKQDLFGALERFGRRRAVIVRSAVKPSRYVSTSLALAIASRETNIQNIVGDGGHGRGLWQMDDRYQRAFLRSTPGCRSGSFRPRHTSALPMGRVPMLTPSAERVGQIIDENVRFAIAHGVPKGHRLHFALAAYNAGCGGALAGWRKHRDPDRYTAGGDYGRDVLSRWRAVKEWFSQR